MNIKAVRLRNFRGFRDMRIELKPLTVLLGPNSAGKSSFGQALAAMAHAHKLYASTPQVSLTPPPNENVKTWPVDLGNTNDLRTKGADGSVNIELETVGDLVEFGFGGMEHTDELLLSYISYPIGEQSTFVNPPDKTTLNNIPQGQSSSGVMLEGASYNSAKKDQVKLKKINEIQWQECAQEDRTEISVILDGLILKAVTHETGTSRVLSGAASIALRSLFNGLTYLRANRKRPTRGYKDGVDKYQPIGYSGEWTPSILHKKGSDQVSYFEPPQIPQSIDEARKISYEWKEKRGSLLEEVGAWLSRLDLAAAVETVPPTLLDSSVKLRATLKGQGSHDITEIGFGVSQVIPVLVAGLLQPEDGLFIVDLPEAHLHPRPQGAIADFFCSLALSGRPALVETHSEMFFHRLRLRAAQDPKLMDKIAVYFIDPPKDGICSNPRPVGLGFEDELRWPEGFLQEAYETEMQINVVRQSRETRS